MFYSNSSQPKNYYVEVKEGIRRGKRDRGGRGRFKDPLSLKEQDLKDGYMTQKIGWAY